MVDYKLFYATNFCLKKTTKIVVLKLKLKDGIGMYNCTYNFPFPCFSNGRLCNSSCTV